MRGLFPMIPLIAGSILAASLIASPPEGAKKPEETKEAAEPAGKIQAPVSPKEPGTNPAPAAPPRTEVRAVWVTRWDFRTEGDVRKIIAGCAALGLNRVIFQVRGQADAYYRSSFEPWGEELGGPPERGGDPGFDPLKVAIEEAHKRGISLHAWANVLPGWKGTAPPRSSSHLVHAHPEWFLPDRDGRPKTLDREHYVMLNPCLAAVRAHLVKVLAEIVERYPVDGLQIDYIRYLDGDLTREKKASFRREAPLLVRNEGESRPGETSDPDLLRRRAMDQLVAEISKAVHRRPEVRLSLAAIRESAHARERLYQDAEGWKRRGLIDDVYPMNYEPDPAKFQGYARHWVRACGGESVVMGIGVHLLAGAGPVREEIRMLRGGPAIERPAGYCLFAYSEFYPSTSQVSRNDAESVERRSQLRTLLGAMNGPAKRSGPAPAPSQATMPSPPKAGGGK